MMKAMRTLPGLTKRALGAPPLVVGTLTTSAGLRHLGREQDVDLIEVRADALMRAGVTVGQIHDAMAKRKMPALLTLRTPEEGGAHPWDLAERAATFLLLLPVADAIDLELASLAKMRRVVAEADQTGKRLVVSAHAIARPATPGRLAGWERGFAAVAEQAWCCKVAARADTLEDLRRLAALMISQPRLPWAVMGLGTHAALSRSVLSGLGSALAYGYLDDPAAPGQPSAKEVAKRVGRKENPRGGQARHAPIPLPPAKHPSRKI
jgi:3-dehydroquinate dehydratase I